MIIELWIENGVWWEQSVTKAGKPNDDPAETIYSAYMDVDWVISDYMVAMPGAIIRER